MGISLRSKCKPEKKLLARKMRKAPTEAEKALWQLIRCKRLGVRAKRQTVIRGYIVDFYIPAWNMALEADGDVHLKPEVAARDRIRDHHIGQVGIKVMRFTNDMIANHPIAVLGQIREEGAKIVVKPRRKPRFRTNTERRWRRFLKFIPKNG